MIYIIINQSHNWNDPIDNQIDFISTSLSNTERIWNKYYSHFGTMDDSKWCYSADLREYPDGYFLHSHKFKVLKHIDNIGE